MMWRVEMGGEGVWSREGFVIEFVIVIVIVEEWAGEVRVWIRGERRVCCRLGFGNPRGYEEEVCGGV
jgi:hypothetical protein